MNIQNISIETVSNGFIVTENAKKESTNNCCGCNNGNDGCKPFTVGGYIVPEKLVFTSYSALMQFLNEKLEHIGPEYSQMLNSKSKSDV